jgi:polysaccharide export outer membrane protein
MNGKFLFLILPVFVLFSCKSIPKHISYFEDLNENGASPVSSLMNYDQEPKIIYNDILRIIISAPNVLDTEILAQFNLPFVSYLSLTATNVVNELEFQTYSVDKNGEIDYPVLGKIKVEGLTIRELKDLLTKKLLEYVSDPVVNISLITFRVNVLGEVKSPGAIYANNTTRFSVLDAISQANDLTMYGDRQNIKLIRNNNGHLEYAILDLTSTDIFSSPYFYLQQNDVIVVDPTKTRKRDSAYGQADSYRLSISSMILSSLSLIASTAIAIISINRK